jgi:Glycosyl transferase family 2
VSARLFSQRWAANLPERLLSVVTATIPERRDTVLGCYESLINQEMPAGWRWEWVVQEDSETPSLAGILPDDARIGGWWNGVHGGSAQTRNLALARCGGSLVRVLDDDDELEQGALFQDIEALEADPSLGWATSPAVDILPDGSTCAPAEVIPPGRVERGVLFEEWKRAGGLPPVVPGTMTIRRSLLRAFGGWMALPASEDTGILMAVSSLFPGHYGEKVSLRCHKSAFQITAQEWARSEHTRAQRFGAVEQRVDAILTMLVSGPWPVLSSPTQ